MTLLQVTFWELAINYNQELALEGQGLKQSLEGQTDPPHLRSSGTGETLSSFLQTRAHAGEEILSTRMLMLA